MGILNRVSNTYKTGVVSHLKTQPYTSILKIFGSGQKKNPLELKMKFVVALMVMTMMVYCSTAMAEDPDNYGSLPQELDEVEERRARVRCNECGTVAPGNRAMACYSRGCQRCIRRRQPAGNCGRVQKCSYCGTRLQRRDKVFGCQSSFCQGCKNFGPRKRKGNC